MKIKMKMAINESKKKKRNNDFEEYKNDFCVCTLYVLIINDTL